MVRDDPFEALPQVGHDGGDCYALGLWETLTRYCDDGRLEIDNNASERALRVVALGRKN
jgi:transposase